MMQSEDYEEEEDRPASQDAEIVILRRRFVAVSSPTEAGMVVTQALVRKLSQSLPIPANVDVWQPMLSYGLDSLLALELRNWLATELSADVPIFEIMGGG